MGKRHKKWCDICRDEAVDLACSGEACTKSFHISCLRNVGIWESDDDDERYLCPGCKQDEENDEFCYKCQRDDIDDTLLLCDGCPRSVHLSCLKMIDTPEGDSWYCPVCDPDAFKPKPNRGQVQSRTFGKTKLGNVTICYVCQKGGRLLGCDLCDQSFHPKCIDPEFVNIGTADDQWGCPICQGEDPLKNMLHKRLSKQERRQISTKRQGIITKERRKCQAGWSRFLWRHRRLLVPFVESGVLTRIKKAAVKAGSERSSDDPNEFASIFKGIERQARAEGFTLLKENLSLRGYQKKGVVWLLQAYAEKSGAILADEMGLGKTMQTLAFLGALRARRVLGPHLVIVPLSTVGNWLQEIRKFTPYFTVTKICGSKAEREHSMNDPVAKDGCYDITVTTYETCVTEEWFFADNIKWSCLILDEAHKIKNQTSRVRHSLDRVSANMRVLLTGTPLQNNVRELFTLLNFLFPTVLRDSESFEAAFQTTVFTSANDIQDTEMDEQRVEAISSLLQKMMLRRTKDLVVSLPKKIEHQVWLPMNACTATWYDLLLFISTEDLDNLNVRKLLGTVIKMRICCSHPRGMVAFHHQEEKLQKLMEQVDNETMKALVSENVEKLKMAEGWDHVNMSSKLIFLDRLLCQLHRENCRFVPTYVESYERNREDALRKKNREAADAFNAEQKRKIMEGVPVDLDEDPVRIGSLKEIDAEESWLQEEYDDLNFEDYMLTVTNLPPPKVIDEVVPDSDVSSPVDPAEFGMDDTPPARRRTRIIEESEDSPVPRTKRADVSENSSEKMPLVTPCTEDLTPRTPARFKAGGAGRKPKVQGPKRLMHRVLVFSQFRLVLDELQRYCEWRGWTYMRLDGTTNRMIRELDIREFNSSESTHLVYLIGTRSGGVGINLVTANHVVLYDEDWNPFVDLQAVDRAHRIGQNRHVHIWKLATEWSVEERMAFRREQKLKMDKLLIQVNKEDAEAVFDEPNDSDDKMSAEEIRKLLNHGRGPVQYLIRRLVYEGLVSDQPFYPKLNVPDAELPRQPYPLQLKFWSLRDFVNHKRMEIPDGVAIVEPEEEASEDEGEAQDDEAYVSVKEAQDEEEARSATGTPPQTPDRDLPESSGLDSNALSLSNLSDGAAFPSLQVRRTQRVRRQPKQLYNPLAWQTAAAREKKVLVHETRCFLCNEKEPRPASRSESDSESDEPHEDAFIKCSTCPKVYHRSSCLGLTEPPKRSWMCPWHECCLCFRRISQAGGLLIHCSECPTSFCNDCFPPEYTRFRPSSLFYDELCKRGFKVTPDKWITFLCSKCKALKEQDRRRKLDKEALEEELGAQRDKQKLLKEMQQQKKAQEALIRQAEIDAKMEKKRQKTLEQERKKEVEEQKRKIDDEEKSLEEDLRNAYQALFPTAFLELMQTLKEKHEVEVQTHNAANSDTKKARKVNHMAFKAPKDAFRLCDNCHMPLHDSAACPFPAETIRVPVTSQVAFIDVVDGTPRIPPGVAVDPTARVSHRAFCSKCGQPSRAHSRRHCARLSVMEVNAYQERHRIMRDVIKDLQMCEPLKASVESPDMRELDSMRRALTKDAENVVKNALTRHGLKMVVQEPESRARKRQIPVNSKPPPKRLKDAGGISASRPPLPTQQRTLDTFSDAKHLPTPSRPLPKVPPEANQARLANEILNQPGGVQSITELVTEQARKGELDLCVQLLANLGSSPRLQSQLWLKVLEIEQCDPL
ncbi:MAG: hypothetical protein KVP17_004920 [Porospora cf. gigantea B]|uniref:uncharacterized protein n=2 Tax=Porospora cf. gigantea B TaxID=2853592 RepID=UPI003571C6B4|nr:MAG: hypothetical protein KVP17_004920 [Porospora cf. gigantea B]